MACVFVSADTDLHGQYYTTGNSLGNRYRHGVALSGTIWHGVALLFLGCLSFRYALTRSTLQARVCFASVNMPYDSKGNNTIPKNGAQVIDA